MEAFVEAHHKGLLKIPLSGRVDSKHTIEDLLNFVATLRFSRPKSQKPVASLDDPGA